MTVDVPPFASGLLDRDAATRMSEDGLLAAWADPAARVLRLHGLEIPVFGDGAHGLGLVLAETDGRYAPAREDGSIGHVYLGRRDGAPVFAELAAETTVLPDGAEWMHPFQAGARLSQIDRELVAVASALLRWHEAAAFSPRDGAATLAVQGGWARHDASGSEFFPRTDPAVIVLIEHENRVLLGSNTLWETGRFSLLAGFVEAGESLEQAVIREVFEESGVRLGAVEYQASQPWPFPRSLMIGFRARLAPGADPDDLVPDPTEISELRWFSRDQVRTPDPGITLPAGTSIARWLLDRWVAEGD
ncbi:NAD(+) diphosphatase [Leucobacter sp. gxy201]|uniref:NAD(+) diphosphatase n=1 Tax=Leucobacter sp. gxy201 TaxID=2957200 RepID=UPI003DA07438